MKLLKDNLLLYLVTDSRWTYSENLAEQVEKAIIGGVTAVQYREKNLNQKEYMKTAFEIKKICNKYKVPFIINDSPVLAREIGADGVHVGQNDAPVDQARLLLGDDKIIGTSAHNVEEALKAQEDGADYIGVGAVFGSKTKTDVFSMNPEKLNVIADSVNIPVVAIGGVNEENIHMLCNSNISGIAVISAILAKNDVKKAAETMLAKARGVVYE